MFSFYRYLSNRLTAPFEGRYIPADGAGSIVVVASLVNPETMLSDSEIGLCCLTHHGSKAEILPLVDIEVDHDRTSSSSKIIGFGTGIVVKGTLIGQGNLDDSILVDRGVTNSSRISNAILIIL